MLKDFNELLCVVIVIFKLFKTFSRTGGRTYCNILHILTTLYSVYYIISVKVGRAQFYELSGPSSGMCILCGKKR